MWRAAAHRPAVGTLFAAKGRELAAAQTAESQRIGATGTLKLRKGVITSPYLNTSYCDRAMHTKGSCWPTGSPG